MATETFQDYRLPSYARHHEAFDLNPQHLTGLAASDNATLDPQTLDAESYKPLIISIIDRLSSKINPVLSREDMLQEGYAGLLGAFRSYDPERGAKFSTFAVHRIRGSILDASRNLDIASRSQRKNSNTLDYFKSRFYAENGRMPSIEEISHKTGLDPQAIQESQIPAVASIEGLTDAFGIDKTKIGELVDQDQFVSPDSVAEINENIAQLRNALSALPPRERYVVENYYIQGKSLKLIAQALHVHESRASQLKRRALKTLRQFMENAEVAKLPQNTF